jgi:hypothetical protein
LSISGILISSVSRIQYDMGGGGVINYIYVSGRLLRGFLGLRSVESEAFRLLEG